MSPHPSLRFIPIAFGSLLLLGACADVSPTEVPATPSLGRAKAAAGATGDVSVVLTGLNAPKQLVFGPEGALYVVESGTGAASDQCIRAGDAEAEVCYTLSGSITRLWKGQQERIVTGLPSRGAAALPIA